MTTKSLFTKLLVLILISLSAFVTSCGGESSSNTQSDTSTNTDNNTTNCPNDPARCEARNQ